MLSLTLSGMVRPTSTASTPSEGYMPGIPLPHHSSYPPRSFTPGDMTPYSRDGSPETMTGMSRSGEIVSVLIGRILRPRHSSPTSTLAAVHRGRRGQARDPSIQASYRAAKVQSHSIPEGVTDVRAVQRRGCRTVSAQRSRAKVEDEREDICGDRRQRTQVQNLDSR